MSEISAGGETRVGAISMGGGVGVALAAKATGAKVRRMRMKAVNRRMFFMKESSFRGFGYYHNMD